MSGDEAPTVMLGKATAPLVSALAVLVESGVEFVLVGGLAVMARLQTAHRATQDLDALNAIEGFKVVCARRGVGSLDDDTLTVAGVTVDSITVDDAESWEAIAKVDEPLQRLFVAGHLFAHGDAELMRIVAGTVSAEVPVASMRSLLVTKLHAYLSPRRRHEKRSSDALDVVRLAELVVRRGDRPLRRGAVPDVVADAASDALTEVAADPAKLTRHLRVIDEAPPTGTLFDLILDDLQGPLP